MKLSKYLLFGTALAMSSPAWASPIVTIYGGFEDTVLGDYDYNDLVFSLSSGDGLVLNSTASLFAEPVLRGTGASGQVGTPFWNNVSADGSSYNVGYCIYGGGTCNGGIALDHAADFLAANPNTTTGSANDVTFSVNGGVSATVSLTITSDVDSLGWYNVATPTVVTYFSGPLGSANVFHPGGDFGLVGKAVSAGPTTTTFYSNTAAGGTSDSVSHFAFFENPTPEPASILLAGVGLLGLGFLRRRKVNA